MSEIGDEWKELSELDVCVHDKSHVTEHHRGAALGLKSPHEAPWS